MVPHVVGFMANMEVSSLSTGGTLWKTNITMDNHHVYSFSMGKSTINGHFLASQVLDSVGLLNSPDFPLLLSY